ncbi:MAG: enoyl-CoA hydratase/isomerase family protein [Rhodobacteraceae bacterium]|nr:enoyl-CoA hydratase/isomerase family protein [Paracoccaceae bacterium]
MSDLILRIEGCAGRITLNRPAALNAVTWEMCREIERAILAWAADPAVALVVIDAAGGRAFCAGGDLTEMYRTGRAGDHDYGRRFWRDEYRMNARLHEYPKPIVSFLHGFVMGGGVGVGCHASHRIVGETAQVAMPECGIGLVPDVGGSLLLANAPGRCGEYLALTAARMGPADAIHAGFADRFVPEARWEALKAELCATGNWKRIADAAEAPPEGALAPAQADIDRCFAGETSGDIVRALKTDGSAFAAEALARIRRNAPLSMACAVEMIHRLRGTRSIRRALELEYRFTHRAMQHGDFLEGIRALIIDKDRNPRWRHADPEAVPAVEVSRMLMPLGAEALRLEEELA